MTEDTFDWLVEDTLNNIKETIIIKGKEYRRNNNIFHNFDVGSQRTGLIRERIIDGFLLKHEISISDMVDDLEKGILPSKEAIEEKFNDNLIYLILKKASIIDRINKL